MTQHELALLLGRIEEEWRNLPGASRPGAVWVCLHDPLPDDAWMPSTAVRRVWFLDHTGMRERDPWEYQRFYTVHVVQPWAAYGARDDRFGIGRHEIAVAAVAEYAGSGEFYVGWQWAGLNGRGLRVRAENGALRLLCDLWVS